MSCIYYVGEVNLSRPSAGHGTWPPAKPGWVPSLFGMCKKGFGGIKHYKKLQEMQMCVEIVNRLQINWGHGRRGEMTLRGGILSSRSRHVSQSICQQSTVTLTLTAAGRSHLYSPGPAAFDRLA